MRQSSKGEGTKIAQAAKDLNVTSVTIRRYIAEFNIETTDDENGIKVLPSRSMDELHEIRRLKEEGLTNPKVLEALEEMRTKAEKSSKKEKAEPKKTARRVTESVKKETKKPERKTTRKEEIAKEEEPEEEAEEAEPVKVVARRPAAVAAPAAVVREAEPVEEEAAEAKEEGGVVELGADGRSKHSLTCQTCGKVFEHMNPRLRDCLDCYRAKRKERRRGGDKHKNVIQHPIAQQVASKQAQQQARTTGSEDNLYGAAIDVTPTPMVAAARERSEAAPLPLSSKRVNPLAGMHRAPVRNYRKAIEETRQITANLKRRLERPDLPENERRWLEQIYAYQLILHQGWRHLAEYKAGNTTQRSEGGERGDRTDRGDRHERGDRPERGDRLERGDRPERGDRLERGDRPDRGDRLERGDRPDRGDRSDRFDRS